MNSPSILNDSPSSEFYRVTLPITTRRGASRQLPSRPSTSYSRSPALAASGRRSTRRILAPTCIRRIETTPPSLATCSSQRGVWSSRRGWTCLKRGTQKRSGIGGSISQTRGSVPADRGQMASERHLGDRCRRRLRSP